ncbi:UDP-N-acetylglucosamine 2-epimerase (non-hydrolyzing) [Burkholderiales bacterium]|nr:UDP-N-acetylglucosamine 2-epimerase (non-hydrolyzing) [Burkholderiales bacterium]
MSQIDIIAGARPNFMKIAPIIREIETKKKLGSRLDYRLVHTGQHYDHRMSGDFFKQLGIPKPHVNLSVGSGSQAEQTARIMMGYEKLITDSNVKLCLVVGDVTSTLACAIVAKKACIPVAHVEGGIRSGDWTMVEEVNRVVTDSLTDYFFTTSEFANKNLIDAGVDCKSIFFVGNTMIDSLLANVNRLVKPSFYESMKLEGKKYFIVTLHRPHNVDDPIKLKQLMSAISIGAEDRPVLFPVHPRTLKTLKQNIELPKNFFLLDAQPYLEFNYLVKNAAAVLTDSGGVTEEATVLGVPCFTLRTSTERPETVLIGTNELVGDNPLAIKTAMSKVFSGLLKSGGIPPKWDGKASKRIVGHLETLLC